KGDLLVRQAECTNSDERVMKNRYHRSNTVDQLKAEPEVNQHADQRIERRQFSLVGQLLANLRTDDLDLFNREGRVVIIGRERVEHAGAAGVERQLAGVALRQ